MRYFHLLITGVGSLLFAACPHVAGAESYVTFGFSKSPYQYQIDQNLKVLEAGSTHVRSAAIESLGYLRAYSASDAIAKALADTSPDVRREAAMSLVRVQAACRPATQGPQ